MAARTIGKHDAPTEVAACQVKTLPEGSAGELLRSKMATHIASAVDRAAVDYPRERKREHAHTAQVMAEELYK